ncbi:MAG: TonB-dependent receptor [Gammaproteobacteria bacterium]|nr:TonB-dependent receptor [Gammaproteobacteria bacterium]MBU2059996.1 TonB-dependent receptor [Gammaproteobacteria bacterium]MBU2174155.1 TonB-dependent receptor [Gammaproteobacteria bacterium]MBU2248374.1 TonB-dependent receptor [Gammaproteobacteria bacterium]MBU2392202.1 TonB-dependent receptor [Gammaproteobacteria bacterium]
MSHYKKMKLSKIGLATLCALFGVSQATAQQAEATEQNNEANIEKIEVTGSRLKGVDMEGANPLQIFSRDDLARKGYDSVSAFLRDLPQASSAGTFTENGGVAGNDGTPAGAAGVSLRGLGSSSTLVLVNGRRVAVDSFTNGFDSFVNVNAIPMSALERVEILTDGASSVYGSDAIAGVINFILRRDYEGQELTASYGDDTASSDFRKYNLTYTGGFSTANSNTTVVIDYFDKDALFNSDRPIDVTFKSNTRVTIDGNDYAEPWCGTATSNGGTRCSYDYVNERAIQPDSKTIGATLNHIYRLGNDLEFFAEAMLQQNTGSAYDSAAAFDVRVAGNSAFVPQWAADLDAEDGEINQIRIRSRFPERRIQDYDSQSYRILAGLRGELGDWSWETAASYGKTDNEITHVQGYMGRDKVADALANGSFNPFNLGRDNSESVIAGLREIAPRIGESDVYSVDFNFSGMVFDDISAVFGGEFRGEEISDNPAEVAQSGGIFALGASDAAADRTQYALYSEFNIPLTEKLDAIAALRYDHYSDFGGAVNPKLSLRYRATEDLILRSSWSTGFRAPSLSQLGAGTSLTANYIDCGTDQPFDALCGDFGATAGELEFDQETLGNKNLDAESSEAINIGASWNLTDDLQFTIDYWHYSHEDIVDVDANTTLRACIAGTAPVVDDEADLNGEFGCVIDAGNDLTFLRTGFFNVGSQETDGVDFKLNYKLATSNAGDFKFSVAGTRTLSYERQITADSPAEDLLGKLSGAAEIARPEFVADAGTEWRLENWNASLGAHYISSLGDGDFKFDNETVDSWLTYNASLGYDITEDQSVLLSIRNLTDKEPPYASSPTNGYASSVHDWLGRHWTLRYSVKF